MARTTRTTRPAFDPAAFAQQGRTRKASAASAQRVTLGSLSEDTATIARNVKGMTAADVSTLLGWIGSVVEQARTNAVAALSAEVDLSEVKVKRSDPSKGIGVSFVLPRRYEDPETGAARWLSVTVTMDGAVAETLHGVAMPFRSDDK